ncbi:hypothetical protein HDV05_000733, partial [Chytridiales sp. JEL 0842]
MNAALESHLAENPPWLSIMNPNPVRLITESAFLLHHLFEAQADATPQYIALSFLTEMGLDASRNNTSNNVVVDLTYAQIETRANQLAHHIRESLLQKSVSMSVDAQNDKYSSCSSLSDTIIPVYLPQSPDFYISVLAVLKSGCAFLPLAEDMPADRIQYILHDCNAPLLITNTQLAQDLLRHCGTDGGGTIKTVKGDSMLFVRVDDENDVEKMKAMSTSRVVDSMLRENHLAYVQYTSGSTGKPKGTMIEHGSIADSILAHVRHLKFEAGKSRFLQFASVTFDVSIFEIFFPWAVGLTLCGAKRDFLLSDLESVINILGITHTELTPTVASLVTPSSVPTIQTLITIGEMLTPRVVQAWATQGKLQSAYGPTEAAVHVSLTDGFSPTTRPSNLGKPLETCSWYVMPLSDDLTPVPVGCLGELCLGGSHVGRGYLNRPSETSKAFLTGLEGISGGRLYRTGDLVRMLPDGTLDIL